MSPVDVIIPAGGSLDDEFARVVGVRSKALISLEGKTVLARTIEALRASGRVGRIVLIASEEVEEHPASRAADDILQEGKTGPENIFRGLDHLLKSKNPPTNVMIVTSDLPFLKPETVQNFLDLCPAGKDFCVPLISKDEFAEQFPGAEATFVKLRDGEWTTGCMYLATASGLKTAIYHIEKVFERRKSKLGIARLLGFKFVWDYLFHKLVVSDVEAKVQELLACRAAAVPGSPAELAFDIDHQEDYQYAVQAAKSSRGAASHL